MLGILLVASSPAWAIPRQITFQGTLKKNGVPLGSGGTVTAHLQFAIVDCATGNQISGTDIIDAPSVQITQGLFSQPLTIPSTVNWNEQTPCVQIYVEGEKLSPPQPINANLYAIASIPTGSMLPYAGASAPTGWLICDGSAVSRTTYAALFSVIGTVWGPGDGSSTFNLPDLRGRTPIGAGQGAGLTNRALGDKSIGEETHTLSIAEMPAHNHETAIGGSGPFGTGPVRGGCEGGTGLYTVDTTLTSTSGGGLAHNNMQPSAVVNFIIKS